MSLSHDPKRILPPADELDRRARRRHLRDRFADAAIGGGGMFVILAITLIFFYLLYEVWPLLQSARMEPVARHVTQASSFVDIDEYSYSGLRIEADGRIVYFRVSDGGTLGEEHLPLPAGAKISTVARASVTSGLIGLGLSNGQVLVIKPSYDARLDETGTRHISPGITYPYGQAALPLDDSRAAVQVLALRGGERELMLMGMNRDALVLSRFDSESSTGGGLNLFGTSTLSDDAKWVRQQEQILPAKFAHARFLVIGQDARWAYAVHGQNQLAVFSLQGENGPALYQQLSTGSAGITAAAALLGNVSLLLGDDTGRISQWFMVRDESSGTDRFSMTRIRGFQLGNAAVTAITPEERRKGFVAGDSAGHVGYFYTTSERSLGVVQAAPQAVSGIAVSARSEMIVAQTATGQASVALHAEHPDISLHSAWGKVWYESYPSPGYTWQSTSGNIDFEGKLSLVPLTFGTLKAAFYAMLLGAPLAICAAMYTAVFMAPRLRRKIKPAIELMEALPTVILGFLAGLWLAPTIEAYLPGIFSLILLTPLGILLSGLLWSLLPREKRSLADGWIPLLLIVPVLFTGWLSFALSQPIELHFFGGDLRQWLRNEMDITFDQRNALIVGLAMGFAVIPNIYAIAEDALFAVPRHLTNGSLALGATPWQTLMRVVLPTASPGIFSAVMIGFGRAVGETMIVLMATGNTPVMDWNIFEGMRTLSANVAVEMGEAEVGSTHFRVLFLSALVLFVLTFVLNTVAEIVRSRLRKKYGSL